MVITMTTVVKIEWFGTISRATGQLPNRAPVRAVATRPVPCRIASATVK